MMMVFGSSAMAMSRFKVQEELRPGNGIASVRNQSFPMELSRIIDEGTYNPPWHVGQEQNTHPCVGKPTSQPDGGLLKKLQPA